jgi:protein O-GlcNAc transferase
MAVSNLTATTAIALVDGVRIVVPDSLHLITPYVLMEQQDWFEDEIRFLRRLLQPGQKVIDIGANYGVYTLSMARIVGVTGCVWAFEPAAGTAKLLAEGIVANGFSHVVLDRSAVSGACGTAQLSLNQHAESNALTTANGSPGTSETVPLVTLDHCLERHGWRDIGFLKIDAEGEESNILRGGKRFFAELSPLVQYEIKAGDELHMDLVQAFGALGYRSFRLVPGLDLLVPFDTSAPSDPYLLNLFCCKPDRAAALAARGFLLDAAADPPARLGDVPGPATRHSVYGWRNTLARLPYGARFADRWEKTMAEGGRADVDDALSCYALSRDPDLSSSARFGALAAALGLLRTLCERQPSGLRLASLARVARDCGERALAVDALLRLRSTIAEQGRVDPEEPFLAPAERFDSIPPGSAIGHWVLGAVLEEIERLGSFSSFFTGKAALPRLEAIRALGFGGAEMEARLRLLQRRFGLPGSAQV